MGSPEEDFSSRNIFTQDEVIAYLESKNIVPGTILWSTDVELDEDSIRSGGKKHVCSGLSSLD